MYSIESKEIKKFDSLESELLLMKEESNNLVFDISSKNGKEDCKSHIAKLRKLKKPIVDCHKFLKADILKYGKALDVRKKELIAIIEDMIEHHNKPIQKIIDEEKTIEQQKQLEIKNEIAKSRKRDLEDIGMLYRYNYFFYEGELIQMEDVLEMDGPTFNAECMRLKMVIKDSKCKKDKIRQDEINKAKEEERLRIEKENKEKAEKAENDIKKIFNAETIEIIEKKTRPEIKESVTDVVVVPNQITVNELNFPGIKDSFLPNNNNTNYGPSPLENVVAIIKDDERKREAVSNTIKLNAQIPVNETNFPGITEISKKPLFQMEPKEISIETKRIKNNETLSDLMLKLNMSEPYAKNVIKAIFKGDIRNVKIEY